MKKRMIRLAALSLTAGMSLPYMSAAAAAEETDTQLGFAQCSEYINIRSGADTTSDVVGKIYHNGMLKIEDETEDGWYLIQSGNVHGYIRSDFVVTGDEAEELAETVGYTTAEVGAWSLHIRSAMTSDSDSVGEAVEGQELEVVADYGDWVKVVTDDGVYGYVSADYVHTSTEYRLAETLEEEALRLKAEAAEETSYTEETYAESEESHTETEASYTEETYAETEASYTEETYAETEASYTEETYAETEASYTEETSYTETEASYTETEASYAETEASYTETEASYAETEASYTETEASYAETEASYTETEASYTETEASYTEEAYAETEASYTEETYAETEASYTEETYAETEASYTEETYAETEASYTEETSTSSSSTGQAIADYASQFVGNPYVYGGSSLTSGADCSGFVMAVFANFGISLPHYSGSQMGYGTAVDASSLQPGDLVFYGDGGSQHVAIYIGGGSIVHAANASVGITITGINWPGTPTGYRRLV